MRGMRSLFVHKKIQYCLFIIFAAVMLSLNACAHHDGQSRSDVNALIEQGILAPFSDDVVSTIELTTMEAVRGDIVQSWMFGVNISFPNTHHLSFSAEQRSGNNIWITTEAWQFGRFSGIDVRTGDRVQKGDVIAALTYDVPEEFMLDRHRIQLDINNFVQQSGRVRENFQQQIAAVQQEIQYAFGVTLERASLNLRRLQLELNRHDVRTQTRIAELNEQLERVTENMTDEILTAPIDGIVTFHTIHTNPGNFEAIPNIGQNIPGTNLQIGRRIVSIVDDSEMVMTVEAPLYALRYGNIIPVTMLQADFHFYAVVASDPLTQNMRRYGLHTFTIVPIMDEYFDDFLRLATEQDFIESETDFLGLQQQQLRARPSVPIVQSGVLVDRFAVHQENQRHYVYIVYPDGSVGRRFVTIGESAGLQTQILQGIEPGQRVVVN